MFAPMIKDLRDVMNASRPLCRAQGKIVVLRQIEFFSEPTDFIDERTPVRGQVADVHKRTEQFWAPFWFEKRRVTFSIRAQSVFVAVENFPLRKSVDGRGELVQSKWRQEIIVIDAGDEITRRESERVVAVI